jgi:peptide/nickel transport system substrate-binding protein
MMNLLRRCSAWLAVLVLCGGGWWGCSDSGRTSGEAGELIIGTQFDIGGSMDPKRGLGGPSLSPKLLVFETPVYFDEGFEIQPLLLTAWQPSSDGRTWILTLRKDVHFSDGKPLGVEDLMFSIDRMRSPGSAYANIASMEPVDAHTLRVTLEEPDGIFIHTISSLPVMSPGCLDPEGRFVEAIGTGPFTLVEYVEGSRIVYARNESYWGEQPKSDRVIIRIIPDASTRSMALESGEVDVADYLPVVILRKLEENPDFVVLRTIPSPCVNWIGMNPRRPPFDDVRVRRAVNHAVNVEEIVEMLFDSILPGFAVAATRGPHSQKLFEGIVAPDLQWYPFDRLRAAGLLEEAGWKDTDGDGILDKDGRPFKVTYISTRLYAEGAEIAEVVQSQLKDVGIKVDVRVLESGARFQAYRERDYDMIELGGICPHNDPTPWYDYYFHSRRNPAYCVIENPAIDAVLDRLSVTADPAARAALFQQLQGLLEEHAPGLFLYVQHNAVAYRRDVQGFRIFCGMTGFFSYARYAYK